MSYQQGATIKNLQSEVTQKLAVSKYFRHHTRTESGLSG